MSQQSRMEFGIFHQDSSPVPVADSHVLLPAEQKRLSAQSALVLARLRQGPARHTELLVLAAKYTNRIHDLRTAGYRISNHYDKVIGASVYTLHGEPK